MLDLGAYDTKALRMAIFFNQTVALEKMVRLGWNLNGLDVDGSTPLQVALTSGGRLNLDAALLLIEHGANVNHQDAGGTTPLMFAADGGRYPPMEDQSPLVMETLLKGGAKINAQDAEGRTALMISALHLRPVLVRLLLKHGARVNRKIYRELRQPDLNRALISAVKKNETVAVVSLLSQGADPDARDISPDKRSGWWRLWDRLRGKTSMTEDGLTALLVALSANKRNQFPPENVPLAKVLLTRNPNATHRSQNRNQDAPSWQRD